MICIHCGEKIYFGKKKCPLCGQQTEFEERYHYIPLPAPIHSSGNAGTQENKEKDEAGQRRRFEHDHRDMDVANQSVKGGTILREQEPDHNLTAQVKDFRSRFFARGDVEQKAFHTVPFLLCIVVLLTILFFFSLVANRRLKNGSSPRGSATSPGMDSVLAEGKNEAEEVRTNEVGQKTDKQTPDSQRTREYKGYWLDFDMNPPSGAPQEGWEGPEKVIFEPGMKAPFPEMEFAGYVFAGWGTAPVEPGRVIAPGEKIPLLTEDSVLYGIWHKGEENRTPEEYKAI